MRKQRKTDIPQPTTQTPLAASTGAGGGPGAPVGGLGIHAYAQHRRRLGLRGHSPSAIQRALRDGRIRRGRTGKIDPVQADADWERATSPARQTPIARRPSDRPGTRIVAEEVPSVGAHYADARAVRELYAARLARLEFEERSGALVNASEMKLEIFRICRQVRDRMQTIPGRVAAQLAAETDARRIRKILDGEIRKALEALANE